MTDTLEYRIIELDSTVETGGNIELREYSPHLVAEVDVEADGLREAAERGFRPLADYIFGNNRPKDEIAMTTPVTARAAGQKITMTSPVTSSVDADGSYTVRFSMPSKWTMDTLPRPNNDRIRLLEVPAQQVLARRFRGRSDSNRMASGARELLAFAEENDLVAEGEPTWAGYSAPYVPVPLRTWEMLMVVRSG